MNRIDTIGQNGNEGDHYGDTKPLCFGMYSGRVEWFKELNCTWCCWVGDCKKSSSPSCDRTDVKQDNGLTAKHYELPDGATELKHLIWYKNMNGQVAEAFRALYRLDDCAHSTRKRDLNKAKAYINQELERMEKYDEQG